MSIGGVIICCSETLGQLNGNGWQVGGEVGRPMPPNVGALPSNKPGGMGNPVHGYKSFDGLQ